jgi:glycosyltransferase involved in cell wall biosynthesis
MKPTFAISCPIDTYSGYGARSRDLVKAIIELDKHDVKIIPQRWGNTAWNFISENSEWEFLTKYILKEPKLDKQPEIWMQITVPNEFQPVGKYNIGVTAGMETTLVSGPWVEGCNRMNLVITSSNFAKEVFQNTKYEVRNAQGLVQGNLELKTAIKVLFEGVDLEKYKPTNEIFDLQLIKEDFAYLFVGHWLQGDFGQDRKNVGFMIKAFLETFKNKAKKPALILKTSVMGSSIMDRDELLKRINSIRESVNSTNLPNIYLIHGDLSDEEMNVLYNHPKVKAMISFTKGEGFGRPLLEFSTSKKPIIASNWSAHTEFLNSEFVPLINGKLENVHPSAAVKDMILTEAQWFQVDSGQAGFYLRDMFENYKKYLDGAKRQAYKSKTEFSWDKMKEKLDEILTNNVPDFPKEVKLNLPKLELPKLEKING